MIVAAYHAPLLLNQLGAALTTHIIVGANRGRCCIASPRARDLLACDTGTCVELRYQDVSSFRQDSVSSTGGAGFESRYTYM